MQTAPGTFFPKLVADREDSAELIDCMEKTVEHLLSSDTNLSRPGMLLGKIQSGKTRAYLGVIALAFDRGYDVVLILQKGTKALAEQTEERVRQDFAKLIEADYMQVHDIMHLPKNLTGFELQQKLIIVAKKQKDNLRRVIEALSDTYSELRGKRLLIIDDEADYASVTFRKEKSGDVEQGKIATQIDQIRGLVASSSFLQVTATPYSLYLQPSGENFPRDGFFKPKLPSFTVLVPVHPAYVGGDFYFGDWSEGDVGYYLFQEVSPGERDALAKEDGRRLKLDEVLTSHNVQVLRRGLMNFIVGGCVRRLQQTQASEIPQKYSFIVHTETSRAAHDWQRRVVTELKETFVRLAKTGDPQFRGLVEKSYADLKQSIAADNRMPPSSEEVIAAVSNALSSDYLMVTTVNSNADIEELLDDNGQLRLRTPLNIFIGGQILDRGVTIGNLIGFYYGRSPKRMQQDTVLQHSRMYGARPPADLTVTRFYTTAAVYDAMRRIHEFDAALREAFESKAHDRGVYFVRKDDHDRIVPCAPNKLLLSNVVTLRAGRRILPVGFQSLPKTRIAKIVAELDGIIERHLDGSDEPRQIGVMDAVQLIELIQKTLDFPDPDAPEWSWRAMIAGLEHLSRISPDPTLCGKVWILARRDRSIARQRQLTDGFRFSDAPDTKQQSDIARATAITIPMLMVFRQNGEKEDGWGGYPFWWPVLVTARATPTSVFSNDPDTNAQTDAYETSEVMA